MRLTVIFQITVYGALWCTQELGIISVAGSLQVPSLQFDKPFNGANIELFSTVVIACTPPWGAPYPLDLNLGKIRQPLSALISHRLTSRNTVLYSLFAIAQHEGSLVCWYNVSRTGEMSGPSLPVNLTISSVPQPKTRLEPAVVLPGGNYTVFCDAPFMVYNTTFRLYFRNITGTASEEPLRLAGSLTVNNTGILYSRPNVPEHERLEYLCDLEAYHNHRIYRSPLSTLVRVLAGMAPARLLSQFDGLMCAGRLEMFLQNHWSPVCQGGANITAMWAAGHVTCRELGCGTAFRVSDLWPNEFGLPVQQSVVGPLQCTGRETRIIECLPAHDQSNCVQRKQMEVICSDFLPPPKLLVSGYKHTSYISIYDDTPLEMTCTLNMSSLGNNKVQIYLRELTTETSIQSMFIQFEEKMSVHLRAPVPPGKYGCFGRFTGFHQNVDTVNSNTVTITISKAPNRGLIAGAVFAALMGAGILCFMCIWRVKKE